MREHRSIHWQRFSVQPPRSFRSAVHDPMFAAIPCVIDAVIPYCSHARAAVRSRGTRTDASSVGLHWSCSRVCGIRQPREHSVVASPSGRMAAYCV